MINSRLGHFTATPGCFERRLYTVGGTPYSEVTVSICRVPSHRFTRAPEDFLLVYLCRIPVRFPTGFRTRFFSAAWHQWLYGLAASHSLLGVEWGNGFAYPPRLRAWPISSNGWVHLASCVTPYDLCHPIGSTGVLTCCPSATPFGLALGTD